MKFIDKKDPPPKFVDWKNQANENWQPNWSKLANPEKKEVRTSLLKEQGYICCYCGRRIDSRDSHIEHFKPRNLYPDLQLDYDNLIASCNKDKDPNIPPPVPVHCGHKKDKWYEKKLMVSPLIDNCTEFFRYTEDGQILATESSDKQDAAAKTIEKLDLNISKLQKMRQAAIAGILDGLDIDNVEDIQKLITAFEKPNTEGKYDEFCFAIVYVLNQLI